MSRAGPRSTSLNLTETGVSLSFFDRLRVRAFVFEMWSPGDSDASPDAAACGSVVGRYPGRSRNHATGYDARVLVVEVGAGWLTHTHLDSANYTQLSCRRCVQVVSNYIRAICMLPNKRFPQISPCCAGKAPKWASKQAFKQTHWFTLTRLKPSLLHREDTLTTWITCEG